MNHRITLFGIFAVTYSSTICMGQTYVRTFSGSTVNGRFGAIAVPLGDLNADGFPELAIGAPDDNSSRGRAEVHDGNVLNSSGLPLWQNAGSATGDSFGTAFAAMADLDGDGIDEVLVSSPDEGTGRVRVVSGQTIVSGFGDPYLSTWSGTYSNGCYGTAIVNLGDLDGDGFEDFAIGAPCADVNANKDGAVHIVSGMTGIDIYAPLSGLAANDDFGSSLANAGDVDSDGFDDLFIGAPGDSTSGTDAGAVHLVSGKTGLPIWATPLRAGAAGDRFGASLATGGDVDADGIDDLAVGAPNAGAGSDGRVWVFRISLVTALVGQREGVAGMELGTSVSIAGDLDADLHADVFAGAPMANYDDGDDGAAFVFSGAGFGPLGTILWSARGQAEGARFGASVVFSPDLTGDGRADLIVGAIKEDTLAGNNTGRVSVYANQGGYVGTAYCAGDGSGTSCSCGNNTGFPASGCRNSERLTGTQLLALGTASIANDDLTLHATESVPNQPGLFFQGNNRVNGGLGNPFGAGLRCAGGGVVRLQTVVASATGEAGSSASIASAGGVHAGATRRYQWWYRDPSAGCGGGFNLSNGVEIVWVP